MSAADRQRRYHARRASGCLVLPVHVDEVAHVEKLIALNLLDPRQSEDREAISMATSRLLQSLALGDIDRNA